MTSENLAQLRLEAQRISHPRTSSIEALVKHLGAVQAQDYPGALWSLGLRVANAARADVERAIADRRIVRTWPMRGTLHFVPAADARWMLETLTPRILSGAAGRHRQLELDDATFKRSRTLITKAMNREPVLTRAAIYALLDEGGISTAGQRGIHIVRQLAMERTLVCGPHSEKQPTFARFDEWIPDSSTLDRDDALRTLAERFFVSHGPATLRDFVWWTGLRVADAKIGLHLASPSLVQVGEHWMSATHASPAEPAPRAHLLPGFDEFMLGYKDRGAALAAKHAERVVPGANGVFLATLVLDGQVCGTWRRSTRGNSVAIEATSFSRLEAADRRAFAGPVERYAQFVGTPVTIAWNA